MTFGAHLVFTPVIHEVAAVRGVALEDIPWQRFERDWWNRPTRHRAEFRLIADEEWLRFEASAEQAPSAPAEGEGEGKFLEGLWGRDVAELFLAGEGESYVEWNLSPHAAWWAQGFIRRRERDARFAAPDQVTTWAERVDGGGWRAGLILPFDLGGRRDILRINVAMILDAMPGDGEKTYLATVNNPDGAPDFHLVSAYPKSVFQKF